MQAVNEQLVQALVTPATAAGRGGGGGAATSAPGEPLRIRPTAPPPQPVSDADVLARAADLLQEFGWCQGRLGSKAEGEFCAVGAVVTAGLDLGDERRVFEMRPALRVALGVDDVGFGFVEDWNDAPQRTKAEVVALLRRAAELACG